MSQLKSSNTFGVGYGFDLKKSYSQYSATRPIFDVENNTRSQPATNLITETYCWSTQKECSDTFDSKANVQGFYKGFTGELKSKFGQEFVDNNSKWYSEYLYDVVSDQVDLINFNPSFLLDAVKNDPDLKNLPSSFDHNNENDKIAFVNFFSKYGTHFIKSVTTGGKLSLLSVIEKSFMSSKSHVVLEIQVEYLALFGGGGATDWKKVEKLWMDHAETKIEVTGGDVSLINASPIQKGDDRSKELQKWVKSVNSDPVAIEFVLEEISNIFSGSQRNAVSAAIDWYMNSKVEISVSEGGYINNNTVYPETKFRYGSKFVPMPTSFKYGGTQIMVIDRTTCEIIESFSYELMSCLITCEPSASNKANMAAIYNDHLRKYENNDNYIIGGCFFGIDCANIHPTSELVSYFQSIGCDEGINTWGNTITSTHSSPVGLQWAFLGHFGAPQGKESIGFRTTRTKDGVFFYQPLFLEVFMQPTLVGNKLILDF